jgi:transposase
MDEKGPADKAPFSGLIDLLASIPGVSRLSALTILSEIGRDMSRFSSAGHLVAWAGLCPGRTKAPASANAPACARALPG